MTLPAGSELVLAEIDNVWTTPVARSTLITWLEASRPFTPRPGTWASGVRPGSRPALSKLPWFEFTEHKGRVWCWRVTLSRPQGVCGYVLPLEAMQAAVGLEKPRQLRSWRVDAQGRLYRVAPWQHALASRRPD